MNLAAIGEAAAPHRGRLQGAGLRLPATAATTTATRWCLTTRASYALYQGIRADARLSADEPRRDRAERERRAAERPPVRARAGARAAAADLFERRQAGRAAQRRHPDAADDARPSTPPKSVPLPPKLFSHNDQQSVWQSIAARRRDVGLGRAHRRPVRVRQRQRHLHLRQRLGQRGLPVGRDRGAVPGGVERLGGADRASKSPLFGSTACSNALRALVTGDRTQLFEAEHVRVMSRSIDANESLTAALWRAAPVLADGLPEPATASPTS